MDKRIEEYIKEIITCLKCSEAEKDEIEDEMRDHLYLLVQEYAEEGYSEKEAAKKAIQAFGQEKEIKDGLQKSISPFYKLIQYGLWVSFSLYTFILLGALIWVRLIRNRDHGFNEYFIYLAGHIDRPSIIFNEEVFALNTNFVPFGNIYMYLTGENRFNLDIIIHNTIGNVLIFVPLGIFFFLILSKESRISKAAFFFITFSLFIEILQYVLRVGQFDVDDVILHTLGGLAGCLIVKLAKQGFTFSKRNNSAEMEIGR